MEKNSAEIKKILNILDYLYLFVCNLKTIFVFVIVFIMIGCFSAFIKPREFVSTSKTIHKYSNTLTDFNPTSVQSSSNLEIASNDNLSVQSSEIYDIEGLPQHIIKEIAKSNTFLFAVAQEKCIVITKESSISYMEYLKGKRTEESILSIIKKYTIGLPGLILSKMEKNKPVEYQFQPDVKPKNFYSPSEKAVIKNLSRKIRTRVNRPKNEQYLIIDIAVKAQDPYLSYYINQAVLKNMKRQLHEITTEKVKNSLKYIDSKFLDVRFQLSESEEKLAKFMDRNLNPQDAKLKVEIERLKRNVSFTSILYQDLQSKKTQMEINLQKTEPEFATIDEPQLGRKEGRRLKKIIIKYFVLGLGLSFVFLFFKINFHRIKENAETSEKLSNIADELKRYSINKR